ncbi:MAG TPA: arginine--tRNA ligase [Acidimicrobiales bacterium]|nr:arginine--tRNA ligase [Acidimicrobiales bacterium]
MSVAEVLAESIVIALNGLGVEARLEDVHLERPARPEHGEYSTNVALVLAKRAGRKPRELADELAAALEASPPRHVEAVEVAGPGFVNFHLRASWLHEALVEVVTQGESAYAAPDLGHGERTQIEFVSANPTGPLHVGNGWFGSYGDALGRIMSRTGWDISREFYVNDTGGQIRRLGESVLAFRRGVPPPDDGYQGEYVHEIAAVYDGPEDVTQAGRFAAERILMNIRQTLDRLNIFFDEWYSQASIEESGRVAATIEELRARGHIYEDGGAVWFRATTFGDSRDRVLVKSDGDTTYLAGDLAYHRNKFIERGFERVIDIFGADTHGHVASLRAGMEALGVDPSRLEVRIGQMISLVGGRMSKRSGNYVRLDTLIDDIGADATRLLSLLSSIDQATTLDLDILKERSAENPVFYVQYAHARIASIDRVAADRGIQRLPLSEVDLGLLEHPRELDVLRALVDLPRVVEEAAVERAPHKVTNWVRALAGTFHGFYHDCYVMGEGIPPALTEARLWLVEAARIGLAIGLDLLGVGAPDEM